MDKRHIFYQKHLKVQGNPYRLLYVQRIPATPIMNLSYGVFVSQNILTNLEEVDALIEALTEARMALEVALRGDRFQAECVCRAVPVPELEQVIISSEDSCPVHGFGTS